MMDNKIIFRIETDKPLPVEDFTKSLEAFNKEYIAFSGIEELQISEIRKGSFEVEFISKIVAGLFSELTDVNSIFEFINHLKSIIASLKRDKEETTKRTKSIQNISDISRPIINNYGTLNMICGGENFILNSQEAQDINKIAQKVLSQKFKTTEDSETNKICKKVLFHWWQVGFNEKKPNSGNKGIIENISKNPIRVIFQDDDSQTKEEMTTSQNGIDWQKVNYVVDVEVITKDGKIAVYKILQNYMGDSFVDDEKNYFE